jgi:succinate dehydrogenase / fumarate reductase cytochrome b subunit
MLVSILHRVTGGALSTVGAIILVWWLLAAAGGPESYETFTHQATAWYGIVVLVGISWTFFQHTLSGVRHLVMDIGAGYELKRNKFWANMTLLGSVLLTVLLWAWIWWRAHG